MSRRTGPSYTVRRWTGLGRVALEVLSVVAVGVLFGVLQDRWAVGAVLTAVALVLGARALDRATLAFRIDSSGVTWARAVPRVVISHAGVRRLDWASVQELEVVEGEAVRARLRSDAPLPGWRTGRVVTPGGEPEVVEGDAPGVQGARVREVANSLVPQVSVRCLAPKPPGDR
ncbi:MAG: hypothetical protein ACLGH4_05290 [Actinomycetes bacterium]